MEKGLAILLLISLFACGGQNEEGTPAAPGSSFQGYTLFETGIRGLMRAQKYDAAGKLAEQGYLKEDSREGAWTVYQPGKDLPKTVASYVNGKLSGPYTEFSPENKITLFANYENNVLHGKWIRFQYGELAFTAEYQYGKLNGPYREYRGQGKLAKEITYKEGELEGPYRFFDDTGKVVLEYTYKKGKRLGD